MKPVRRVPHDRRRLRRPDCRIAVPEEPPESWSTEEVKCLLWPDLPDHLPVRRPEEGWPQLLGRC